MKRFAVLILAIVYFCVSSGFVLNIHYCMGKLSSMQVDVLPKKGCLCKTNNDKGCCKTEHKIIKLQTDQKISSLGFNVVGCIGCLPSTYYTSVLIPVYNVDDVSYSNHSPPKLSYQDIYLKNCVFRI